MVKNRRKLPFLTKAVISTKIYKIQQILLFIILFRFFKKDLQFPLSRVIITKLSDVEHR